MKIIPAQGVHGEVQKVEIGLRAGSFRAKVLPELVCKSPILLQIADL